MLVQAKTSPVHLFFLLFFSFLAPLPFSHGWTLLPPYVSLACGTHASAHWLLPPVIQLLLVQLLLRCPLSVDSPCCRFTYHHTLRRAAPRLPGPTPHHSHRTRQQSCHRRSAVFFRVH
jgi:hypothetical protein